MHTPIIAAASLVALAPMCATAQDTPHPWWREAVFYQIFVRSFADSTTGPLANDGIGDLRGIIERIDYLNDGNPETTTDLGITGIWLLPINPSPSYHGYDVTDYTGVNAQYGTHDDLRELLEICHARGIRVIIDLVINHCSSQHRWFLDSVNPQHERHDWFVWRDEPLTGPGAPNHTVWHDRQKSINGKVYYGFFYHGMPDFNLRSPGATAAIHDFSTTWLKDVGIDGFRLDAIKHLIEDGVVFENTAETIAWLEDYRSVLRSAKPDAFVVGEVWAETEQVRRYIPGGVDSAFEFDLAFAIERALNDASAPVLAAALDTAWKAYGDGVYSTFLGNHDMDRTISRLGGSMDKAKTAATILLTMPGVPFIYYGEEIGMSGVKPDPDLRTPMQWTADQMHGGFSTVRPWRAVNQDGDVASVRTQHSDPQSLLNLYRRLIRVRSAWPELSVGTLRVLECSDERVLVYERAHNERTMVVIVNLSGESVAWPRFGSSTGGWKVGEALVDVLGAREVQALGAWRMWTPVKELQPHEALVVMRQVDAVD